MHKNCKVAKHERGEIERLERLVNKYERGQIQQIDWLDRLTFKAVDKIKDRESPTSDNAHLGLVVNFCSFEHRVVFQVSFTVTKINSFHFNHDLIFYFMLFA